MNSLQQRYRSSLSLFTDLYQLTMAYGYWKSGRADEEAVFHWFYRNNPFNGAYAISCGLEDAIAFLQDFRFREDDLLYLSTLKGADGNPLFEQAFLDYLGDMRFDCSVEAIPEGTIVFPHQPLLRIKGSIIQAQIIETPMLNILNFQTLIATKSARIVAAAQRDKVLEFGLRRAQGIDGSLSASRAAYIGGCHATSNVLAGKLFDIPVKGTHAHSWVMSFDTEEEAFSTYAEVMPNNCIFLVDTYDTVEGVKQAIEIGLELRKQGQDLLGVRLDSGNLIKLSQEARQLLDEAGFEKTVIVASDSLDEYKIEKLKREGALITVWGVGTRMTTAYDQPALGGVYKLAAIRKDGEDWKYRMKLSENPIKISNPGILQARRYYLSNGAPFGDMIFNELAGEPSNEICSVDGRKAVVEQRDYEDLLQPIFNKGTLCYHLPNIHEIRQHTLQQIALYRNVNFDLYPVGLDSKLQTLKKEIICDLKRENS